MKIAMVFDQFLYGGIERVGVSYINLLVKSGHSIDVYILREEHEDIIKELDGLCNVKIIPFDVKLCPEMSWQYALNSDYYGMGMLKFALRYGFTYLRSKLFASKYKVVDKHYDIAIAFSGHMFDLTFVADGFINCDHKIGWLHGSQYQYFLISPGFYRLYSKIKNLVCLTENCDVECLEFNKTHNINKRKISNPCFIKTNEVDKDKVEQLRKDYGDFCLMVGRLADDKDQETVIKAMKVLRNEYGLNKKLLLVGDGNKREYLEDLVSKYDMTENVVFEGSRSDVQNYYSAATVYVHGSPMEGLPGVFLEAMHFGLPVVSTEALAGGREILGNNEYGLISDNWDEKALAKNIKRVYEDANLRETLIRKGSGRVLDFAPEKIIAQLNEFLLEINNKP